MLRVRAVLAMSLSVVVVAALAGCAQGAPARPTHAPKPAPSASSTAVAAPSYHASGTASENIAYFNKVGNELFTSSQANTASTQGEVIVNWFVSHGFDKSNMEVTPDKTSIGLSAWNIDFSVRFSKTCILGQAGNVGFQSSVVPILATGKCLIGQTRPITW